MGETTFHSTRMGMVIFLRVSLSITPVCRSLDLTVNSDRFKSIVVLFLLPTAASAQPRQLLPMSQMQKREIGELDGDVGHQGFQQGRCSACDCGASKVCAQPSSQCPVLETGIMG